MSIKIVSIAAFPCPALLPVHASSGRRWVQASSAFRSVHNGVISPVPPPLWHITTPPFGSMFGGSSHTCTMRGICRYETVGANHELLILLACAVELRSHREPCNRVIHWSFSISVTIIPFLFIVFRFFPFATLLVKICGLMNRINLVVTQLILHTVVLTFPFTIC